MATAGSWSNLSQVTLHSEILRVLDDDFGFPTMTPVQAVAIPPLLSSKDVCVEAETGSGKTLSFLIPIAQQLLFGRDSLSCPKPSTVTRAIVLLPTRELATQVHAVAVKLFSGLPGDVKPVPLIGGAPAVSGPGPDSEHTADQRVVIATPGRLSAALSVGALRTSSVDILIMDEADRLLDMGFAVTITDILTKLPKQRRTGMYSATQTSELDALARAGMRNPVRVVVRVQGPRGGPTRKQRLPTSLQCFYQIVSPSSKLAQLLLLLAKNPTAKVIVYTLTCATVEYLRRLPLNKMLGEVVTHVVNQRVEEQTNQIPKNSKDINESSTGNDRSSDSDSDSNSENETEKIGTKLNRKFFWLHGKMTQKRRERNLRLFSEHDGGVLICTDVAARGIDIADVDWVVQLDVPQDPDAYIHRVGRTGRLGRTGRAVIYLGEWEEAYVDFLRLRKCDVSQVESDIRKDGELQVKICKGVGDDVKEATVGDRAILDAAEKAFLSYVRAYKEHRCGYLLKLSEIDINAVVRFFGLVRLPRFYEFKSLREKLDTRQKSDVNVRDIAYKDKRRERHRQEQIREAVANRAERKKALAEKSKKRKRGNSKKSKSDDGNATKKGKVGRATENRHTIGMGDVDAGDEDDFSMEAMLLRKVKRGRMSRMAFDKRVGYDEDGGEGCEDEERCPDEEL